MTVKEEVAPDETRLERLKRINRLAAEIYTFIEDVWPHYERTTEHPDTPFNRKAKGESNSPIPESAIALMDANRRVADLVRPKLEAIEAAPNRLEHLGVEFRALIRELRYDPGAIKKWRDSNAKEEAALWTMCVFVATLLDQRRPGLDIDEFWVETSVANALTDTE